MTDMNAGAATYQVRVHAWILHCFGSEIGADKVERNHRFLEEALELVQSGGCTESEAQQLVRYVFSRPVGDLPQEVGGVMNTLAAFCNAHGLDMQAAAEAEMIRVWAMSDRIRAKQAAKPKHSALPVAHDFAPDLDAAREAGRREGMLLAARLCEAERLGWTHNAPQAAGAIAAAGCRDAIRALIPAPARAAGAAAGEASDA